MDAAVARADNPAVGKEKQAELHKLQEDAPVWDEATGLFWCTTSVNPYDVPDACDWKRLFQEEVDRQRPEVAKMLGLSNAVTSVALPPLREAARPSGQDPATSPRPGARRRDISLEAPQQEPLTPTRLPRRLPRDSPKTPPPTQGGCSERRVARAAHTKALTNIKQKAGVSAVVQGKELGFFRFGGKVFAVAMRCPHQGGNLCEGEVGDIEDSTGGRSCYVTCPVHKMQFELESGGVIVGDCPPLETFAVRIRELDEQRREARIEVGFTSLSENYFFADEDMIF